MVLALAVKDNRGFVKAIVMGKALVFCVAEIGYFASHYC
jgi:hypothetical protein